MHFKSNFVYVLHSLIDIYLLASLVINLLCIFLSFVGGVFPLFACFIACIFSHLFVSELSSFIVDTMYLDDLPKYRLVSSILVSHSSAMSYNAKSHTISVVCHR